MRIEKIRLDEVKKTYGDIKALEDISLSLYQGELLCVAGLSGCLLYTSPSPRDTR